MSEVVGQRSTMGELVVDDVCQWSIADYSRLSTHRNDAWPMPMTPRAGSLASRVKAHLWDIPISEPAMLFNGFSLEHVVCPHLFKEACWEISKTRIASGSRSQPEHELCRTIV